MLTVQSAHPEIAAGPSLAGRLARWGTLAYLLLAFAHGLLRLRSAGLTPAGAAEVGRLWYVESLGFLAAWGVCALAVGLIRGGRSSRRPPRARGRTKDASHTLAALTRDRIR